MCCLGHESGLVPPDPAPGPYRVISLGGAYASRAHRVGLMRCAGGRSQRRPSAPARSRVEASGCRERWPPHMRSRRRRRGDVLGVVHLRSDCGARGPLRGGHERATPHLRDRGIRRGGLYDETTWAGQPGRAARHATRQSVPGSYVPARSATRRRGGVLGRPKYRGPLTRRTPQPSTSSQSAWAGHCARSPRPAPVMLGPPLVVERLRPRSTRLGPFHRDQRRLLHHLRPDRIRA